MRPLLASLACALVLAASGCSRFSEAGGETYALMQMNLCLSGFAGCYDPAVVGEAVSRVREARPDAITLNETCERDAARIARRSGYHLRFSRVIYAGKLLRCVGPGGRGLFGNAVLTRAAIRRTEQRDFEGQAGPERRRWLCVTTRVRVEVCTAHLNTRSPLEIAGNRAQCRELAALLARRADRRTVIFGGDVNRPHSCAPPGFWTRSDRSADRAPGLQHAYGSGALRTPNADVTPAEHSDHDFLLVRARLMAPGLG